MPRQRKTRTVDTRPPLAVAESAAVWAVQTQPRAKLFPNGRSQAVRLPKEFRLPGTEVLIRRDGACVVLEPLSASGLPVGFWEDLDRLGQGGEFPDAAPLGARLLDVSKERLG
jgi:antitoxin VapB